jgi:acyl-CoA dehydrogenase family protein 9
MAERPEELGFLRGLFFGDIQAEKIIPFPAMKAEERDNLKMLLEAWEEFAQKNVNAGENDRKSELPESVRKGLFDLGVMGLTTPEEFGGIGLSFSAYCRFMETIASTDASLSVFMGAHQSIGIKPIILFGNEAQKKKYLPGSVTGEWLGAFALTEPGAGSDVDSLRSTAKYDPARKGYLLTGEKIWITNGGFANLMTLFAKTEVVIDKGPDKGKTEMKITAFIVEPDSGPGFSRGQPEHKLGLKASNTVAIAYDNFFVPEENVLGKPGDGFKIAVETLNMGRVSLGAGSTGGMKVMMREAAKHAKTREQFKRNLLSFEIIQDKLAQMAIDCYALESMVYLTAGNMDKGEKDFSLETAACKIFGTERLWHCINDALQIAGGLGFMQEYPYERYLRDSRINMIFEGTNEILRVYIALSGMRHVGKYLGDISKHIMSIGGLTELAQHKMRQYVGGDQLTGVHPALIKGKEHFEEAVQNFSKGVDDILQTYKKGVIEKEFEQQRLANAAILLYAMAATLSRATADITAKGEANAANEIRMAKAFCAQSWRQIETELNNLKSPGDKNRTALAMAIGEAEQYPWSLY